MELAGTCAIVTGAASGLGAATAASLVEQGVEVFGFDLPSAFTGDGAAEGVTAVAVDVTKSDDVEAGVAAAVDSGLPLRVVVNCAGIAPSARILGRNGPHDLDLYLKVLTVNLAGSFNVMTLAAAAMAETDADEHGQRGVVVLTASVAAYEGQIGQAAYASSKGGVVGLTLPAARDLAQHGIRVCTIAPGIVDTPMLSSVSEEFREGLALGIPFPQRLAQPTEYSQLVRMIIEHDYINGEVIRMDGALRMSPR